MKWATRPGVHGDRTSCAWLIRRFTDPEARGLDVIIRGLSMVCDDDETLAITARVYDGLYEHRRRATTLGREPS